MEVQEEIFNTESTELELLLSDVDHISESHMRQRWPSTLQSLSEVLHSELKRAGNTTPHLADKLTIALSHYFGGRDIYIPNGSKLKSALRNISIWREYNGRNIEQLANHHKLTERQITEIIREQRQAEVKRRQRSLF
ncbi:Mor transcription activator family protein [Photobacterium sanguinicancri]|uniref:Mor transcription activator family protein n=1 Tax=Photobacterium sanguinicancri TaxID=875932 RepID=A0AAW7Y375_9GAMM|nr:Mor transcription activator family protein [Photobacterium sanguinicancri]MDO6542797.1 Mor transcription activator family protein [Photobacterium sanguinicancri]